jgi:3',5'-nucleoside bisphosphate phosphatase
MPIFLASSLSSMKPAIFYRNEDRLLINSVDASFEQVYAQVAEIGGLFIPAHINRKTFGLIANLGLVPTG